ncbi:MAG: hypothetical protein IPO07_28530 [Haliscomenobacter sp.]|nr:hypothetical protein [Haliscomenobacter sp.]MBK9492295.1 hypothetical protein [Haliscomenobacter sp.]
MPSFEDVLKLIELDGGVVFDNSQYKKLGWKFSEPSIEEIEDFNNVSSVNYWSKFLITAYVRAPALD